MSPITTLVAFKVPFRLTSISWLKASGSTSVEGGAPSAIAGTVDQGRRSCRIFCSAPRTARSSAGVVGDVGRGEFRAVGRQPVHRLHMPRDQQQRIALLGEGRRARARPMPELAPVMTTRGPGKESLLLALVGDGRLA